MYDSEEEAAFVVLSTPPTPHPVMNQVYNTENTQEIKFFCKIKKKNH